MPDKLKPLVTAYVYDIPIPRGKGRFLSSESEYLYSLLWDPFILSRTGACPALRVTGEVVPHPENTLLLYAHPTLGEEEATIRQVLNGKGGVVLNSPASEIFDRLPELKRMAPLSTLVSLRERWDLGALAKRTYIYADRAPFFRLASSAGKPLSWIGENPDLVLLENTALFAGDPLAAVMDYLNVPFFSQLLLDLSGLLAGLVSELTHRPLFSEEQARLLAHPELRRDFHAFGFAWLTVGEFDRCLAADAVDLEPAGQAVREAAGLLTAGNVPAATALLAEGFRRLEKENRKLQPVPAVFTDTLHGGGLFPDLGYFEFDWPQHPADVVRNHLHWAKTRSYRFNLDFSAESLRNMADRFPRLFSELRVAQDAGWVECVNGTLNQPYPPFYSLESMIRQLDSGGRIFQDLFGRRPRTYASQEFGFCSQLPALLAQSGYAHAVLRVQNNGDAPTLTDKCIRWSSPGGQTIDTLPSHPYKTEQYNEVTYNNLHLKLYAQRETGLGFAVFSGLGDISYYRPFRDELARICHYAPVFGAFQTWSEYFSQAIRTRLPVRGFTMEDFDCRAGFLELPRWAYYQRSAGNYNSHLVRAQAASYLFAAAEMLRAVFAENHEHSTIDPGPWDSLSLYQGHDCYILPFHDAGSFLGGVTDGASLSAGRAIQVVAEYGGPWDRRPIIERAQHDLSLAEEEAREAVRHRLKRAVAPRPDRDRFVVYNFGPAGSKVIPIKDAPGLALTQAGDPILSQPAEQDLLALVSLPANGVAVLESSDSRNTSSIPASSRVWAGEDFLENAILRVEFDPDRGTIRRLIRKSDGRLLLREGGHSFYLPEDLHQCCGNARIVEAGPVRASLEFELAVGRKNSCTVRSRVSLDTGSPVLRFEEHVLACPELKDDQWTNHLGVKFVLAGARPSWRRCHHNVLEGARAERIFSSHLLLAQTENAAVAFINFGSQFYFCRGNDLSHILIYEGESGREFTYAIGVAQANPLLQARMYVQPWFSEKIVRATQDPVPASFPPKPIGSFFATDPADVEILSCRRENGRYLLRVANTVDRPIRTALRAFADIVEAAMTDFSGQPLENLVVSEGKATFNLNPWDIRQLSLVLK